MKSLVVCTGLLLVAATLVAQPGPPKSPPATETGVLAGKSFTISYASPRVNGRAGHIFSKGGLISHDPTYPVWRAGANAATKLHTEGDLDVGGLVVPKGDYTLYVDLTDADNWVLIVSKQTGQWGTVYDKAQDLGRVRMKMEKPPTLVEKLAYMFMAKTPAAKTGTLSLVWENFCGSVEVSAR
jgi:hypothetical protein